MKAFNKTKEIIIADRVKIANNPVTRIIGLLSRSDISEEEGLLIVPCKTIHSFFMRFVFDAVFLDKEGKVVHLIENMKPWRASSYITKSKKVLELAAGVISKKSIELGDVIIFEE